MKSFIRSAALLLFAATPALFAAAEPPALSSSNVPTDWIDPDTGHRVIRLSREPGTASLYFNQNAYTKDGKKIIVTTPGGGIAAIDLETRAITPLVPGPVSVLMTGHKTGDIYYTKRAARGGGAGDAPAESLGGTVYATSVDTGQTREVVKLPPGVNVSSLNADETMFIGVKLPENTDRGARNGQPAGARVGSDPRFGQANYEGTGPNGEKLTFAQAKDLQLHRTLMGVRAAPPRSLFTLEIKTGAIKVIHSESEWLNHLQFSPTDPNFIMFCHEGPWIEVDRVWTIHTDGTGLFKVHTRTMNMEKAGHEFFSADGRTLWYDLQTPRSEVFWLAGYELATGHRTWYQLQRDDWSVHFNVSPDGKLFAGDGSDEEMVAHAKDAKWIYLFHPEEVPEMIGIASPNAADLVHPALFRSERLVNMSKHDYRLEPNVTFTPDMKWIVFRSNMHGAVHVYAVELAKH
ncbi:MAG TPA: oligogalacturonate lyase family protein [Opitutaceae bacterium]|nr:oligogalacturonate lyase family protein [Opitutaceae bacterium]